jgi:hypothetical protein
VRLAPRSPRALRLRLLSAPLALLTALTLLGPGAAQAATTQTPAPAPATDTLTWSVKPTPSEAQPDRPNFQLDLDPGASIRDSIRVRNFGPTPIALDVYASDAHTTESGALDLLPASEKPVDLGSWIAVDTPRIEVAPGGTVDVPFTLTVPENAESGDHSAGIVTSFRAPGQSEGQAVTVDRRLGNRVQVRVGGALIPRLEVRDVEVKWNGSLNPAGSGSADVSWTVSNSGNVRLGAEQTIDFGGLLGLTGKAVAADDMAELLPGSTRTFTAHVDGLWPGVRTAAEVELQPVLVREGDTFDGTIPVASASAAMWTLPWTQVLVLFLLALVATLVVRRVRAIRTSEVAFSETNAAVERAIEEALAQEQAGSSPQT